MFSLLRIEGAVARASRMIALIALVGLLMMALAIVVDVLLRWLFNAPITGMRDAYELSIAVLISSCFPLCIIHQGNTTIRFVGNALGERGRYFLEAFGTLVTSIVFAAMAEQMWIYSNKLAMAGETAVILGWPVSPWWRAVSIVLCVCVPVQFVVFLLSAKQAIMGNGSGDGVQVRKNETGEDA